jgi:LPS-assembly protein
VGSVVISQGPNSIYGDKAVLSMQTGEASVVGNVRYVGPDMTLFGTEFLYNFKTNLFTIKNAKLKSGNFILHGKKIERVSEDLIVSEGAEITTCQDCPESWTVYGEKVKIVPNKYVYIYSGFITIKGVSFFYVPYLVFPIKKKRETGLLIPKLELSQDDGARFRLPFFWAIDETKDMSLIPAMFGRRGFGSQFEYRQNVGEEKWFQLDSLVIWDNIYLPYKKNYTYTGDHYFRNFNNYEHTFNFTHNFNHHLDFLTVTDSDQLRDFDYLINTYVSGPDTGGGGYLNYRFNSFDLNLEGYLQRNVLVNDPITFDKSYVQILPKMVFDLNPIKIFQWGSFPFQSMSFGATADFTSFRQMEFYEQGLVRNANRTNFVPFLDYNLGQIGPLSLKSNLAFDTQYYDLPYEKPNYFNKWTIVSKSTASLEIEKVFGVAYQETIPMEQINVEKVKEEAALIEKNSGGNLIENVPPVNSEIGQRDFKIISHSFKHSSIFSLNYFYTQPSKWFGNPEFANQIYEEQGTFDNTDAYREIEYKINNYQARITLPMENTLEVVWANTIVRKDAKVFDVYLDEKHLWDNFTYQNIFLFLISQGYQFNMTSDRFSDRLTFLKLDTSYNLGNFNLFLREYHFYNPEGNILTIGLKRGFTLGSAEAGLKWDTFQTPYDKNVFFKGNLESFRPIGFHLTWDYDLALKIPNVMLFGVSFLPNNNCWKFDVNYRKTQIDKAFYFNLQINYDGKNYFGI